MRAGWGRTWKGRARTGQNMEWQGKIQHGRAGQDTAWEVRAGRSWAGNGRTGQEGI